MITVDTNILARYIVGDDSAQSAVATRLIETELTAEDPGFITVVVIVELAWVLTKRYGASVETVTAVFRTLLASPQIVVEDPDLVERALALRHEDLADALIHEAGRAAGSARTVTFDRRFARTPGVELLR